MYHAAATLSATKYIANANGGQRAGGVCQVSRLGGWGSLSSAWDSERTLRGGQSALCMFHKSWAMRGVRGAFCSEFLGKKRGRWRQMEARFGGRLDFLSDTTHSTASVGS